MQQIITNKKCGDIIESEYTHDFNWEELSEITIRRDI